MISTFEFSGHVVGVIVKSNMDQQAFAEIRELIRKKIEEHDRINLFVEVQKDCKISMPALIKHFKFSVENADNFARIAVVTDNDTLKNSLILKDLLIKAEVESFTHENRLEAMRWIAQ